MRKNTSRRVAVVTKENEKYVGAYMESLDHYRNQDQEKTRQGFKQMGNDLLKRLNKKHMLRTPQQLCDNEPEDVETSEHVLITPPQPAVSTTQPPISVEEQDPIGTPLEEEEHKRKIRKLTKSYQDGDID